MKKKKNLEMASGLRRNELQGLQVFGYLRGRLNVESE